MLVVVFHANYRKGWILVRDNEGRDFCWLRRPVPRGPGADAKITARKRRINRLTARAVATLKKCGRHADGQNLYFSISKDGARGWVYLCRLHGRPTEVWLGSAGGVSLALARERATLVRSRLADSQLRDRIEHLLDAAAMSAAQLLTAGAG
jgi:Arm DNA-binding domain